MKKQKLPPEIINILTKIASHQSFLKEALNIFKLYNYSPDTTLYSVIGGLERRKEKLVYEYYTKEITND